MALEILFSEAAAAQVAEIKARGQARPETAHGVIWRGIQHAFLVLSDPKRALSTDTALGNKNDSDFRRIHRVKFGRLRIVYIVSAEKKTLIVLLLGHRKGGDKKDAYKELSRRLKHGEFDMLFEELGIKKPAG